MIARVLLADDQPLFRTGVRTALAGASDMLHTEIVGEVDTVDGLRQRVENLHPDLVITDSALEADPTASAISDLTSTSEPTRVLIISSDLTATTVVRVLASGARGYLDKRTESRETACAAMTVLAGGVALSPVAADRLTACVVLDPERMGQVAFPTLTDRELDVLTHLADGRNNQQIARQLVLSDKTIRNCVSNILTKLQVDDRAGLIVRARRAGLGTRPDGARRTPLVGVTSA